MKLSAHQVYSWIFFCCWPFHYDSPTTDQPSPSRTPPYPNYASYTEQDALPSPSLYRSTRDQEEHCTDFGMTQDDVQNFDEIELASYPAAYLYAVENTGESILAQKKRLLDQEVDCSPSNLKDTRISRLARQTSTMLLENTQTKVKYFFGKYIRLEGDTWHVLGLLTFSERLLSEKSRHPFCLLAYRLFILPALHLGVSFSVFGIGTDYSYIFISWLASGLIAYLCQVQALQFEWNDFKRKANTMFGYVLVMFLQLIAVGQISIFSKETPFGKPLSIVLCAATQAAIFAPVLATDQLPYPPVCPPLTRFNFCINFISLVAYINSLVLLVYKAAVVERQLLLGILFTTLSASDLMRFSIYLVSIPSLKLPYLLASISSQVGVLVSLSYMLGGEDGLWGKEELVALVSAIIGVILSARELSGRFFYDS